MAGMKRFVTYIYAYEEKKKGSNVGFARFDIRGEECRMEIHLRGVYVRRTSCSVCLFRVRGGQMEGFPVGEMWLANGTGDFGGRMKTSHVGESPFCMDDMEGILLLTEDERIFMSRWKEGEACETGIGNFHLWRPQQITEEPEAAAAEERKASQPQSAGSVGDGAPVVREEQHGEESIEETTEPEQMSEQEAELQATEVPMRNIFPEYEWNEIWESLKQNHKRYKPFEDAAAECVQIELKNLRELPKRYWYLGNNSFLLHGFFNYHYLVVGRTGDGRWFLGVPGIYQRQERVMAAIFGFPEFIAVAQEGDDQSCDEPVNRFGCWYRCMEE